MIVYVNGCSYASISDGLRYSDALAQSLNCEVINAGIPGSCNDRILRTSLRDLIDLKHQHKDIVAVISLTFLIRSEVWEPNRNNNDSWSNTGDGDFHSLQLTEDKSWFTNPDKASHLDQRYKEYAVNWLNWYNVEAEITKLLQNLVLFSNWCENNGVDYLIFSGPTQEAIDFDAPFVRPFYQSVRTNPHIIDIFSNSFLSWCEANGYTPIDDHTYWINGETRPAGHQGELAHRAWAAHLLDHYLIPMLW